MAGSRCPKGSGRCSPTTNGSPATTPPDTSTRTTGGRWSGCYPGAGSPGSSTMATRCPATWSGCRAASGRCSTGSSPASSCRGSTLRCSPCCWPARPAPPPSLRRWSAAPAPRRPTWSTWPSCCPGSAVSTSRCPRTIRCGWPGCRPSTQRGRAPGSGSGPPRGDYPALPGCPPRVRVPAVERRVVAENLLLKLAETRARLDTEVVGQQPACLGERLQRRGPHSRPVQRDHETLPDPLVGIAFRGACPEFHEHGTVLTQFESRVGELVLGGAALVKQAARDRGHRGGIGQVGERRVSPQRHRVAKLCGG